MERIAAVLACHNRAEKTLAALRALHAQEGVADVELTVYLLDDASTDGTGALVAAEFPAVVLLSGDGNLFWNGGMRAAYGAALADDHDAYLWLNDDTVLDPGALATLRSTASQVGAPAIVAGSTRDPATGQLTYGGMHRPSRFRPLRFTLLEPAEAPRECETMNGNAVLISRAVAQRVGNLERAYTHGIGDLDYGLRARRAGFAVWITPGTIATCAQNPARAIGEQSLREEWRSLRSAKGLPPGDWRLFARRWAGLLWPAYWASPYVRRGAALLRGRL